VPRVSTPPFLNLPEGVREEPVVTERGAFAALRAGPRAADEPSGGRSEHPRTVVLVPGFTGSKEDFVAVLAPIGSAGFPVVAYDQRGQHGTVALTPGPPPGTWSLAAFADDLLAVSAAVSGPDGAGSVHLLGHSFGGLVARAAVIDHPERFRSLVLLDSGPGHIGPHRDAQLLALADGLPALGLATVWGIMQALEVEAGNHPPEDPQIAAFLEARFLAHDPDGLAAMARLLATEPDRTAELRAALNHPAGPQDRVLVAFGVDDDAWSPEIQRETASRLAAPTVSFPEAAHSPAAEAPGPTATALVAFWDRSEGCGKPPQAEEEQ
jgi:pimeloyl-ACP methyl ester carboxylesterase